MESLKQFVVQGTLTLAKKAKGNPGALPEGSFAAGIANKDYAAQTPLLWNAAYEALGINAQNVRFVGSPEDAPRIFAALRSDPQYLGGDVGAGFKDKVWALLDLIDPVAKEMQSVNVVVKTPEGLLKGYNTDGIGYAESLEEMLAEQDEALRGATVIVLGGGGTANSIAFALAMRGARVVVLNRTIEKAQRLADRINAFIGTSSVPAYGGGRDELVSFSSSARAIVSVIDDPESPLDQYSALGEIELPATPERIEKNLQGAREVMNSLWPGTVISDVMLRERKTATLREAEAAGFSVLDGRPMVLNQAIEAFKIVNERFLLEKGVGRKEIERAMENVFRP